MKAIALALLLAGSAFGQCGRMVYNPITGKMDCIGSSTPMVTTSLGSKGTESVSLSVGSTPQRFTVTLTGNPTFTVTGTGSAPFCLVMTQDGTGSRTPVFDTSFFSSGIVAADANSTSTQCWYWVGAAGLATPSGGMTYTGVSPGIAFPGGIVLGAPSASGNAATTDDLTNGLATKQDADASIVKGPASATDGALAKYNGTTGALLQNGPAIATSVGTPGVDTNIPTEKAVRDALSLLSGYDPTIASNIYVEEEFLNLGVTSGTIGANGLSISCTGTPVKLTADETNSAFGIFQLVTGATATNSCVVGVGGQSTSNTSFGKLATYANWTGRWRFRLVDTADVKAFAGLLRNNSVADAGVAGHFCGVRFDTLADTHFTLVCDNASLPIASSDTGIGPDTNWHVLTMTSTTIGTITLQLDSATPLTTTDISNAALFAPGFYVETRTTSAKNFALDYVRFKVTGLTR